MCGEYPSTPSAASARAECRQPLSAAKLIRTGIPAARFPAAVLVRNACARQRCARNTWLPHMRRDWAHPTPHPAPGLGPSLPHLHRDWAHPFLLDARCSDWPRRDCVGRVGGSSAAACAAHRLPWVQRGHSGSTCAGLLYSTSASDSLETLAKKFAYASSHRSAWRGVAWRGVAWRGVAWRGVAWRGVAWRGSARATNRFIRSPSVRSC